MKLLLRRDIPNVGLAGDVVEVKEGYARNYLIPHHLGMEPTKANMKAIEVDKRKAEEERKARRIALEQEAERLQSLKEVTIAAVCNLEGRLYGSVGPREIAAALRDQGHSVETKQVELREVIRQLDTISVPVRFADDLTVEVKVWVVRESTSDDLDTQEKEPQPKAKTEHRREARYGYGSEVDALETDL
ncbi:MAG TPA: 50S ribosomal protein L9 [Phycisphaerae bacterium]|nr:50S ribosomal protein L9 [Phycisphaerae bacterium]